MRRRDWLWIAAMALVVAVLWAGALLFVGLRSTQRATTSMESSLQDARAAAVAGDLAAARSDLLAAEASARDAAAQMASPMWAAAALLPVVGDSVRAARTLTASAETVTGAAVDVVEPVDALLAESLRLPDGALDLQGIAGLAAPLEALATASTRSLADLDALDVDGLVGPVGPAVAQARDELRTLGPATQEAGEAVALLPGMLGADGPRTWFVMLQNDTEARGTGGVIGAYALVRADRGRVRVQTDGNNTITATPVTPRGLPPEYRRLWGDDPFEWSSLNMSLHFPYAARLVVGGMARRGIDVDGVVFLDQRSVAAILAGTGPVSADGVTIDAGNAEEFLSTGAYARFPDTARKNQVVEDLLRATVSAALSEPTDLPAMLRALTSPRSQGRVLMWSGTPAEEAWLQTVAVGGVLPDAPGPFAAAAFNNAAANKMDAYVSTSLEYGPGTCPTLEQRSTARVTLTNSAPTPLPDYVTGRVDDPDADEYSTRMLIHVYGPVGAVLRSATLDGRPQPVTEGLERDHPVWRYDVTLERGQTRELLLEWDEPTVVGATPVVVAQPMSIDERVAVVPGPPC